MKQFVQLPKLQPGDLIAAISPSSGLAGVFPWVFDLGLQRLRDVLQLEVREYPTTRQQNASLEDRARDIMAAFTDPAVKAVFAAIGGSDQIQLLKLLDPDQLAMHPKPFFGYSDNTHLHMYLWNLGIPSYYGGAIMTQLAMQTAMDDMTRQSIATALFERKDVRIHAASEFNEVGLSWQDPDNLQKQREYQPNPGWIWDGNQSASGILWGGCVESLIAQVAADIYLPTDEALDQTILCIETAEDIPEPWIVEYLLIGMGERGWFDKFQAVLVGRPKAWEYDKPNALEVRTQYRLEQQQTTLRSIRKYNQTIPVIQNVDFGHTDPQTILPLGNMATIDAATRTITFSY